LTSSITSSIPASALRERPLSRLLKRVRQMRLNPLVIIGLVVVILWVLIGFFAPVLAPYEPLAQNVSNRLQPPGDVHFLGTDELGRDIWSRVLWGARLTIPSGLAVVAISTVIGTMVGAISGFLGGLWDEFFMRLTELFMAFPTIILAMAITAALGPDIRNAILALVIVWWPGYARLVRSLVLEVKTKEYVEGARSIGANSFYILFRTVMPNCIAPSIVLATLDIGSAILTFAGLSFLGLGPDPSSPEWGRMVSIGIDFFDQWWMWLFPGLAIASLVMAFNFIGDGLRDALDPRSKRS
jgi:peptide/nickel transport system permease protein